MKTITKGSSLHLLVKFTHCSEYKRQATDCCRASSNLVCPATLTNCWCFLCYLLVYMGGRPHNYVLLCSKPFRRSVLVQNEPLGKTSPCKPTFALWLLVYTVNPKSIIVGSMKLYQGQTQKEQATSASGVFSLCLSLIKFRTIYNDR